MKDMGACVARIDLIIASKCGRRKCTPLGLASMWVGALIGSFVVQAYLLSHGDPLDSEVKG
jgi:hypothetical protein